MTVSEAPAVRRPRPSLIATLRIALPVIAVATLVAVIATAFGNAYHAAASQAAASRPIELIGPQLTGEDTKNRPFVITAVTAEREDGSTNRIRLHNPVLVRDQGGPDQNRQPGAFDDLEHAGQHEAGIH